MGRSENKVESHIQVRTATAGGKTRKVIYQGQKGAPDQWCFLPGGRLLIIEAKATDGRLSQQQADEIEQLKALGFSAHVAYSKEEVDAIFDAVHPA